MIESKSQAKDWYHDNVDIFLIIICNQTEKVFENSNFASLVQEKYN